MNGTPVEFALTFDNKTAGLQPGDVGGVTGFASVLFEPRKKPRMACS